MADEFCLKMPEFHVTFRDLLHAINLRHGTNGFTSLPKEGVLRIFFALKNPTVSAGFEPANLGTKGQHATSRPPKPQNCPKVLYFFFASSLSLPNAHFFLTFSYFINTVVFVFSLHVCNFRSLPNFLHNLLFL